MTSRRYWEDEDEYANRRPQQKDVYEKYRHKLYDCDEEDEPFDDDYVSDEYFDEEA
jgi:hypothetical protein